MAKPNPTQAAYILGMNVKVTEPARETCRANGWVEDTDQWPYYRATTAGIAAAEPVREKAERAETMSWVKQNIGKVDDDGLAAIAAIIRQHAH